LPLGLFAAAIAALGLLATAATVSLCGAAALAIAFVLTGQSRGGQCERRSARCKNPLSHRKYSFGEDNEQAMAAFRGRSSP